MGSGLWRFEYLVHKRRHFEVFGKAALGFLGLGYSKFIQNLDKFYICVTNFPPNTIQASNICSIPPGHVEVRVGGVSCHVKNSDHESWAGEPCFSPSAIEWSNCAKFS